MISADSRGEAPAKPLADAIEKGRGVGAGPFLVGNVPVPCPVMEVVLLIGLQGSGKSTFYRTHYSSTHVLVSKDRLRNNRRPQRRQMQLMEEALKGGRSVVVDNTNPTADDRAPIISLARSYGANVAGFFFESRLGDCLKRNSQRTGRERVPDKALYMTFKRLQPPTLGEGFDRLYQVRLAPGGGFVVTLDAGRGNRGGEHRS